MEITHELKGKRIVLFIYSLPFHFPPTINAANILVDKGAEVFLIGIEHHDSYHQHLDPRVNLIYLGKQVTGVRGFKQLIKSIWFLKRFVSKERIDWVISYDAKAVLPGFLATRNKRAKWMYHQHDFWEAPKSMWERVLWTSERKLIRDADLVSFPQEDRADYYKDISKLRAAPLIVFNAPRKSWMDQVAEQSQAMANFRKKFEYVLIYQGGWSAYFHLERIFYALTECKSDVGLVMLGEEREPGLKMKYEQLLQSLGIRHKVFLAGEYLPYDELPGYTRYADAAIAILTKDDDPAPFNNRYLIGASNKISEYVACGLPVLSQDSAPNRRFFEKYPIGVLVNSDDKHAFAHAIDQLLLDATVRKRISDNNKRLFENELNYDTQFDKVTRKIA